MGKTKISWTDETSNPLIAVRKPNGARGWACVRVSEGCKNCYAAALNKAQRWGKGTGMDYTAPNLERVEIRIDENELARWGTMRKPRKVFPFSMTDLFGEFVPDAYIGRFLSHMISHPHITFQIVTKRAERMHDVFTQWNNERAAKGLREPSNIWLGVSVENQRAADERIPLLLQTPTAVRFLSCEPLLGEIELDQLGRKCENCKRFNVGGKHHPHPPRGACGWCGYPVHNVNECEQGISWVIVGGESGPNFRAINPDWARSIRDQCRAAGVPFFFKQHSGYRPQSDTLLDGVEYHEMPGAHK